MRILIVNTIYYIQGGAPIYTLKLAQLLKQNGHKVIPFSMKHPQNLPSQYEKYFPEYIDFKRELREKHIKNIINVARRTFYFKEAREKMQSLLDDEKIDIVHLNNFLHHLSLSIIDPIVERNIPIVWTLHDHILVCPNTNLFDDRLSIPCARCDSFLKRISYPILRRCKKNSILASTMAAAEAFYIAAKKPHKIPELFISPSEFLKEQHRKMGFDTSRFVVVPNFVDCNKFEPHTEPGQYALYFGRLSAEKGLKYLIEAFAKMKDKNLVIVGTGPDEENLRGLASSSGADNITFSGYQTGEKLRKSIYDARFTILPSTCFENAPLAILESFASGKPVLASDIGGIPELISDDVGRLFSPGNADEIIEAVRQLWDRTDKLKSMGENARKLAEEKFSPDKHIKQIINIYKDAIAGKQP
ncbi:hypothetical protein DRQ26_04265 [bacterium]|nr:MAG: hypothetical protein DRQ26_04265 [bacterium]